MKFKANLEEFRNTAITASKMATNGAGSTAFSGLYMNLKGGEMTFISTNRESSIIATMKATGDDGVLLVSAGLFTDILRKLSGEEVSFEKVEEKDNAILEIVAGKTKYDIPLLQVADFPVPKQDDWESEFTLELDMLNDLVNSTIFAAAPEGSANMAITGGQLTVNKKSVEMVALDGYRLAVKEIDSEKENKEFSLLIPGTVLAEIARIFPVDSGDIDIFLSSRNVAFKKENITLISSLIAESFPDYTKAKNIEVKHTVNVPTPELKRAIERASLMALGTDTLTPVKLEIQGTGIKFTASTERGTADDFIDVKTDVEDFSISFNHKFLSDAVKSISDDSVAFSFSEPNAPCSIASVEAKDEKFLYVVYPMRV